MKPDSARRSPVESENAAARAAWTFGPADAAVAAGLLALTLGVSIPTAVRFRADAGRLDRQRTASVERAGEAQAALQALQARRAAFARLQRVSGRYASDIQARPIVSWATAVTELSRLRPQGVWTTRIHGDGPRFEAEVSAARPGLVTTYVQSLRQSSYVEFAALPPDAGTAVQAPVVKVVGRLRGE